MEDDQKMELPPGFRFHPTDEELITHYLSKKVIDSSFSAFAIGEVDMNKVEPWDLPWKSRIGEKEWYFFCVRDKKYPTGLRTNRATASGYWKATGKDKEILRGKCIVGMKKTLVFYQGRAPKGEKTNWVCHEYRLEGKLSLENASQSDWVICRVFHKCSGGQKLSISGLTDNKPSALPPLTDSSPTVSSHVHCFSKNQQEEDIISMMNLLNNNNNNPLPLSDSNAFAWTQPVQYQYQYQNQNLGSFSIQDPTILRSVLATYGQRSFKMEKDMVCVSQETEISSFEDHLQQGASTSTVAPQQELDCLWSY